jgi:dTDP-4-dehydrorhamnose reductase
MANILVTGGDGLLGTNIIPLLKKEHDTVFHPSHLEMDIEVMEEVKSFINDDIDMVVHCAAIANVSYGETHPKEIIQTNVMGTVNITLACMEKNIRLVYISTAHVFDGKDGLYKPQDPINPIGKYAKSKAAGELVSRIYDNSLSIRTEFFDKDFPFEYAYDDKWASKDYIDILAPKIVEKCLSDETGVCHVGSKRRTFYEIAKGRNPNVKRGKRNKNDLKDTSFYG